MTTPRSRHACVMSGSKQLMSDRQRHRLSQASLRMPCDEMHLAAVARQLSHVVAHGVVFNSPKPWVGSKRRQESARPTLIFPARLGKVSTEVRHFLASSSSSMRTT